MEEAQERGLSEARCGVHVAGSGLPHRFWLCAVPHRLAFRGRLWPGFHSCPLLPEMPCGFFSQFSIYIFKKKKARNLLHTEKFLYEGTR